MAFQYLKGAYKNDMDKHLARTVAIEQGVMALCYKRVNLGEI